jgi:hypothetical protein
MRSMRYEWGVHQPTVLLLSTSDTDLMTARASGACYRWVNPTRLVDGELDTLLDGVDVAVVRILGRRASTPSSPRAYPPSSSAESSRPTPT